MRHYEEHRIDEYQFEGQRNLRKKTNAILMANVMKTFAWIKDNTPTLNGMFRWDQTDGYLTVENGKAYLNCPRALSPYQDISLSSTETATLNRSAALLQWYSFPGVFFAPNELMEAYLKMWPEIKQNIIKEYEQQTLIYSDKFKA